MFHNKSKSKNSIKVAITVPYNVDTVSDGTILSLHIHKKLFPRTTKEQLAATRNTNIQLKHITEQQ